MSLSLIFVVASAVLCQQIISNSISNQQDKNDYAELNNVKYGLLSIDEWKRQITAILEDEINKLNLSKANERVLRKHVEALLNTLIDKAAKEIRERNATTARGRIAQSFIDAFINPDEIKKGIPEYTDAVIREIKKSQTRREIKGVLTKQLEKYAGRTFDAQDKSRLDGILARTNSEDMEGARAKLQEKISATQDRIAKEAMLLIFLATVLFVLSGFSRQPLTSSRYALLVFALFTLLFAGITTPTIDLEAKISHMSIMLLGHPVSFENQVLYFQSKSILDVFWIMITHHDLQMKFVGVLLITFSLTFPLLKIASTVVYYLNVRNARKNPVIRFFVLSSGKWSMADVMVVAIFMAYIGFNGIIANQLGHLKPESQELVLLATNGTSLQPGFYLFLVYTLLALFLSELLTRKPRGDDAEK